MSEIKLHNYHEMLKNQEWIIIAANGVIDTSYCPNTEKKRTFTAIDLAIFTGTIALEDIIALAKTCTHYRTYINNNRSDVWIHLLKSYVNLTYNHILNDTYNINPFCLFQRIYTYLWNYQRRRQIRLIYKKCVRNNLNIDIDSFMAANLAQNIASVISKITNIVGPDQQNRFDMHTFVIQYMKFHNARFSKYDESHESCVPFMDMKYGLTLMIKHANQFKKSYFGHIFMWDGRFVKYMAGNADTSINTIHIYFTDDGIFAGSIQTKPNVSVI